jgi:hypothetical protein
MNNEKQSKWQRWAIIFLFSTVIPCILTYWWQKAPRQHPQSQINKEISVKQIREQLETFESQIKHERQKEQQLQELCELEQ